MKTNFLNGLKGVTMDNSTFKDDYFDACIRSQQEQINELTQEKKLLLHELEISGNRLWIKKHALKRIKLMMQQIADSEVVLNGKTSAVTVRILEIIKETEDADKGKGLVWETKEIDNDK